jgi:2'-5' RNA ligase
MDAMGDFFAGQSGGGGDGWARDRVFEVEKQPPGAVFFAISPDVDGVLGADRTTRLLSDKNRLTGVPRPADLLHVSLVGIGWYPELRQADVEAACRAAAAVVMPPFEVAFDRAASFGGGSNRPLVLCGGDGVIGIVMLQKALIAALERAGFDVKKNGYEPHMTLLYDRRRVTEQSIAPVRWRVREFALIHSLHGLTKHVRLARWTLRGQ